MTKKPLTKKKLKALAVLHDAGVIDAKNVKFKCYKKYKKRRINVVKNVRVMIFIKLGLKVQTNLGGP